MSKDLLKVLAWYQDQGFGQSFDPYQTLGSSFNFKKTTPVLTKKEELKALYDSIKSFNGCPLKDSALNMVFADGSNDANLMLIGEAPGADEDREGRPFVGLSGQLLNLMLQSIGIARKDVYIINMIPFRPPFNRKPTPKEIALFLPFVKQHIRLVSPKILVCVGSTALKGLMNSAPPITKAQNEIFRYKDTETSFSCPLYALFHPSYLLRSPGQKKYAWKQMVRIKKALAHASVAFDTE